MFLYKAITYKASPISAEYVLLSITLLYPIKTRVGKSMTFSMALRCYRLQYQVKFKWFFSEKFKVRQILAKKKSSEWPGNELIFLSPKTNMWRKFSTVVVSKMMHLNLSASFTVQEHEIKQTHLTSNAVLNCVLCIIDRSISSWLAAKLLEKQW